MKLTSEELEILEQNFKLTQKNFFKDLTIEEMSELTTAISHDKRYRQNNIAEEIVDVFICLHYLIWVYDCQKDIEKWKEKKLQRIEGIIEGKRTYKIAGSKEKTSVEELKEELVEKDKELSALVDEMEHYKEYIIDLQGKLNEARTNGKM